MQVDLYNNQIIKANPFLKWAGGKRQLIPSIIKKLPNEIIKNGKIKKYCEPFIGGGALFFYLKSNYEIKDAYISDINKELILTYKIIQKNPNDLIDQLLKMETEYKKLSFKKRTEYYLKVRENFNKNLKDFDYELYDNESILRASQLIFMNRTCFNGLYRVSLKGEFNVPHGKYKNPKICDSENIKNVNKILKNVKIYNKNYSYSEKFIDEKTLVYLDPPYRPLNKTSSFTNYSKEGFSDDDQIELSKFYKNMSLKNAYVLLSNSDPHNTNKEDEFFDNLYSEYNIYRIEAKRNINSDGNNRNNFTELLITNYKN